MRRPATIAQVATSDVADAATSRALDSLSDAVRRLQARGTWQTIAVDLVVGRNVVPHALGRKYTFASVMPTVAGGTWIVSNDNPHPDRQVLIDVAGVAQLGAAVLVM